MSKQTLLLAEKPSVGREVAAWLAKTFKLTTSNLPSGFIRVGTYDVCWLRGHALENAPPHDYDPRYKRWSMADLPIFPKPGKWKLNVKNDAALKGQVTTIQKLLATAGEVIGLGDPDQEGQLLQDELLLWAGWKGPTKRLWLNAVDDATIAKAWKAMKPNSDYAGYYWSALARSHADWGYGMTGSRACTKTSDANGGNATASIGRVQTPVVALVVAREDEIRKFKPVNFFTPFIRLATAPEFRASWNPDKDKDTRLDPEGRLLDRKVAEAIQSACTADGTATVTKVTSKKGSEAPPLPFALSSLQAYMSRRFGVGVSDTLALAQKLYEKKLASYPRTDCEYLPESQHAEAADIFKLLSAGIKELGSAPSKADLSLKSKAFNDKNTSAHHAIVPRPATLAQIAELPSNERLVWVEIAKRYLLQFFPTAEFLFTEIELACAKEAFRATGKVYTKRGWKDAFTAGDAEDGEDADAGAGAALPKVAKGDKLKVKEAGFDSSTTKPPKRYTEGTLLEAMKSIYRYVTDPVLRASLRETAGIGTEATRAPTIKDLIEESGYLELVKKEIKPTALGEDLIRVLPRQLTAPDMTALWQQRMDDIRTVGEPGYLKFMGDLDAWLHELVRDIPKWFDGKALKDPNKKPAKSSPSAETKPTEHRCLRCKGELHHINGQYGWYFRCQADACKTIFKDVGGKPVEKAAAPASTEKVTIGGVESGSTCPACKKGTLQLRVCGPNTRSPGKQFLSCSNFGAAGKAKCTHSVWPK